MNRIKCIDRVISLQNVESMKLIQEMDFTKDIDGISFHPKGDAFFKKNFWSRRKSFDCNMYTFSVGVMDCTYSAEGVVEMMKANNRLASLAWKKFFNEDINVLREQIAYNEEKDCVTRKSTIVIRTKSGDTLYAVYDTDILASKVITDFNNRIV